MSEQAQEARDSQEPKIQDPKIVIGKSPRNGPHVDLEEERTHLGVMAGEGVALCLSGGGIRSATFSLGVIQTLARLGWLDKFTHLSTVSGGGYIGSWLACWIRRTDLRAVVDALKAESGPEPEEIRRLRASSNYLSPRTGISADLLTLVSTFLRNLIINWSILIPVLIVITMLPLINVGIAYSMIDPPEYGHGLLRWTCVGLAAAWMVMVLAYIASDVPDGNVHQTKSDRYREFVYFPVLGASYLLSLALIEQISTRDFPVEWWADSKLLWFMGIGALIHVLAVSLGTYWVRKKRGHFVPGNPEPLPPQLGKKIKPWIRLPIFLAISGAFAGGVAYFGLRLGSDLHHWVGASKEYAATWSAVYATLAVPFLLLCFFLGSVLHVALIRRNTDEGAREWWARSGGTWIQIALVWLALHAVCIWLPAFLSRYGASASAIGGSGALGGVLVAVIGYYSKNKPDPKQGKDLGMLEKLNIRVLDLVSLAFICSLLGVIALCAVDVMADLEVPTKRIFHEFFFDLNANMPWKFVALLVAGLFAVIFYATGVNAFSMHAMYGNRLVRAYLGATRPAQPPEKARMPHAYTGFDPDDDLPMSEARHTAAPAGSTRPFHVINTALNIVRASAEHLEWQERKAASFTVTPLRTGSRLTGYCRTRQIGGRADVSPTSPLPWGLTIGRAMTISGAAAAPNMGFHSSRLVAIVMTFFNVRLGWWMRNPAPLFVEPSAAGPAGAGMPKQPDGDLGWTEKVKRYRERARRKKQIDELCHTEPEFPLRALIAELTGDTREDSEYVYLSDGGHFENLGLYEMVRRQCLEIVVVDAGCDPKYEYEDLERAIRIIRNDLNAEIDIPDLPTAESIKSTKKHYAIGTVKYRNSSKPFTGRILYIKPGIDGGEPLDVGRYSIRSRAKGEPFPHQSTGDQFFDEPQFESYRALGQYSTKDLIPLGDDARYPIELLEAKLAEDAKKLPAALPAAIMAGLPAVPASTEKPARGFGEALSDLISWDKLPGLLATALGGTAVVATLTPAQLPAGSTNNPPAVTAPAPQPSATPATLPPSNRPTPGTLIPPTAARESVDWRIPLRGFGEGQLCRTPGRVCDDGTKLTAGMIQKLRGLDARLEACGRSDDSLLTFTIRGYASTSDYAVRRASASGTVVKRHPDSERLNLALADARARAAKAYLARALAINSKEGDEALELWMSGVDPNSKDAVHARFSQLSDVLEIDRADAVFDPAAAGDNRRIDIEITSPGNCKLPELYAAMRVATAAAPLRTASTH